MRSETMPVVDDEEIISMTVARILQLSDFEESTRKIRCAQRTPKRRSPIVGRIDAATF